MKTHFLIFLSICSSVYSQTTNIMSVGDSVSRGAHLQQLQLNLTSNGYNQYDFVGPAAFSGSPQDTNRQGYGGARYEHMENGLLIDRGFGLTFEPGVVDGIPNYNPDVFLILGGYNNMAQETVGAGLASTISEFESLMDYIFTNSPTSHVLVSNITVFDGTWGHKNQNVLDFNSYLSSVIPTYQAAGENVYLVDNFSDVTTSDLESDGLHVANSGQLKIGDNWYDALQSAGLLIPEPNSSILIMTAFLFLLKRRNR